MKLFSIFVVSFALVLAPAYAQSITCGETVTGSTVGQPNNFRPNNLFRGGDQSFTFVLPAANPNNAFEVTVALCGSDYDTTLAVVDRSGSILATNDDSSACSNRLHSFIRLTATASQSPLTFHVDGFSGAEGNFVAALTCTDLNAVDFETIACGDVVTSTTEDEADNFELTTLPPSSAGDVTFGIPVQFGSRFKQITVDACTNDFDLVLIGRRIDGSVLREVSGGRGCDDSSTGARAIFIVDNQETSAFVITIDGTGDESEGSFTLTTSCLDLDDFSCESTRFSGFSGDDFNDGTPETAGEDENLVFVLNGNSNVRTVRIDLCGTTVRTHLTVFNKVGRVEFSGNIESDPCSLGLDDRPLSFIDLFLDPINEPYALHLNENDDNFAQSSVLSVSLQCDVFNEAGTRDEGDNVGVIVGSVVGGVALVLVIGASVCCCIACNKNKGEQRIHMAPQSEMTSKQPEPFPQSVAVAVAAPTQAGTSGGQMLPPQPSGVSVPVPVPVPQVHPSASPIPQVGTQATSFAPVPPPASPAPVQTTAAALLVAKLKGEFSEFSRQEIVERELPQIPSLTLQESKDIMSCFSMGMAKQEVLCMAFPKLPRQDFDVLLQESIDSEFQQEIVKDKLGL